MSDFHKTSPEMARLRLCRITNESIETENCYQSLNRVALAVELSLYVELRKNCSLLTTRQSNAYQYKIIQV